MLRLQNAKFDIVYIKDINTNHRRKDWNKAKMYLGEDQ